MSRDLLGIQKQTKARAQASIEAIRLVEAPDLKRVPDGGYPSTDASGA